MDTSGFSPGGKATEREPDHLFHLLPRSRMVVLYHHSPIRLHGTVLNALSTGTDPLLLLLLLWLLSRRNQLHKLL
jgi:hypothetical protein